jgi:hypothetical protein
MSQRWPSVASRSVILASLTLLAALALPAGSALAGLKLPIGTAVERSADFAQRTCHQDRNCVRHGVRNCRRQSRRVVLCRIFDERKTPVQGRYECSRLIRLSLDPQTGRVPVTGLGRWQC